MSLIRASSVVKRQLTGAPRLLRSTCQAQTSVRICSMEGMRRFKHWLFKALSSISAMFSQLPCLGV